MLVRFMRQLNCQSFPEIPAYPFHCQTLYLFQGFCDHPTAKEKYPLQNIPQARRCNRKLLFHLCITAPCRFRLSTVVLCCCYLQRRVCKYFQRRSFVARRRFPAEIPCKHPNAPPHSTKKQKTPSETQTGLHQKILTPYLFSHNQLLS